MRARNLPKSGGCASTADRTAFTSRSQHCLLLIAAALLSVCFAFIPLELRFPQAHAATTVITCPYGWSLYEGASAASSSSIVRQCVRVFVTSSVPANAAESTCEAIFADDRHDVVVGPPLNQDGVTQWPFVRYVSPHGAAIHSAEENTFLRNLLLQVTNSNPNSNNDDDTVLILGGVAGYGLLDWYTDNMSATYTNFADDVDWQLHAGTVVMRPSGAWSLLSADSVTAYPFACTFDASAAVVAPDSSAAAPVASSSASISSSSHTGSSSSGAVYPGRNRAHRPAVPQPAPACLDGWTALPSSIDTSEGAVNTVCYRLFANASEVGGRLGKTFDAAAAYCSAAHPKATLASVMSRNENAWIVSTLLTRFPGDDEDDCTCDGETETLSSANHCSRAARTVFLGGSYMRDGAGAGLIGNWYADQYLFNASEYAMTSPSSPAWPTERNDYFSNWGENEPLLSYGVVGITPPVPRCTTRSRNSVASFAAASLVAGTWVGVDPRSTQPFLCSYLNDGSVFPVPPPSTTQSPVTNSTVAPGPSEHCVPGWSYLALTKSCYRVYQTSSSTTTSTTPTVTAATMEEECGQVLRGVVVIEKVGRVHAVSMQSITESNYVGALLHNYINDPANIVHTNGSATLVSLAGISFVDSGESGFYITGVRELDPKLALSLWATSEPSSVKGCVAVDVRGLWYYVPCSAYLSPSMPDNTAVHVEAYTCQYRAKDIDAQKDVIHGTTTTEPEPTSAVGWSSESSSGSSSSGGEAWWPLGERIAALSGATHLVVAAGSTGVYTLQGPNATAPPIASVRGLHLYFSPLSAFYAYEVPTASVDGTAIGRLYADSQPSPSSMNDLLVLSRNASTRRPFAPCEGYKDQSRISRVRANTVTVHHVNASEVGYVCVSQDGTHYVATALTYEVTEVTLHGFIPAPPRTVDPTNTDTVAPRRTWLPPLFCNSTSNTSNAPCAVQSTLAIQQHGTGTVQLALRYSSSIISNNNNEVVVTALTPTIDTMISHVRLSATADCMGADVPFFLLAPDAVVQQVPSARYTRSRNADAALATDDDEQRASDSQYSIFSYQHATVHAARPSTLKALYNSSAALTQLTTLQPPVEYYVCVAVQKTNITNTNNSSVDLSQSGAASRQLLSLWNVSRSTNASSSSKDAVDNDAFSLPIADRLVARTSLSPAGAAVRTYTAVPGLKAHLIPGPVSIKGMWALPPRHPTQRTSSRTQNNEKGHTSNTDVFADDLVTLVPTPATFNRSAHYRLRPNYAYTYGTSTQSRDQTDASPIASAAHLRIPQYSSPVLLLDGHQVQPGMLALLSQDPKSCNRLQPVPRNDPTAAAATWPAYLDTMVPLSTVSMRVESEDSSRKNNSGTVTTMAYMQLNLNHTGLWGHHPTRTDDATAVEQTWYVCVAYGPLSPFTPLRDPALKITVHRLHVQHFAIDADAAFTSSDAVAAAEAADASTTHLNLNIGFAGMLWMHGFDIRLWATATLHSAQVAFSVVLPSSGTSDDTAVQCAQSNLFYGQQSLGLLTQDSRRHSNSGNENDEDVRTNVGVVVPLNFFRRHSTRRMQLCLSVPLPFSPVMSVATTVEGVVPQHRYFAPVVNTTLDVRPIQLLYMGRYSAIPSPSAAAATTPTTTTGGTVIRLAEGVRDVVLPLTGYGIRPDMTMFLSSHLCHGVPTTESAPSTDVNRIVVSQSLLNISVVSLYDLPSSYWNASAHKNEVADDEETKNVDGSGRTHRPRVFVVLRHDNLLRKAAAQQLFEQNVAIDPYTGVATTSRVPLNVCLYAPGTDRLVFATDFQLVVDPPHVTSIRNLPSDAALITRAAAKMTTDELAHMVPSAAAIVYAASMDLVVEGFGLDDKNTWLMPACDCRNASSFLWRAPVKLSALPSSQTTAARIERNAGRGTHALYADSSRYVDPQTSYSSWFATLQQQETVRFGADTRISSGQVIHSFQWCMRIVEDDETTSSDTFTYVPTHIPYQLMIPAVRGFAIENARRDAPPSTILALPTQDPTNGRWFSMQLVGPVIDIVHDAGSPLYILLAPEAYSCHEVKKSYLSQGLFTFGNASFAAVNGSAVLLPRWLASAGLYRLCASAVYPTVASADEGIEAALQFFNLDGLRVQIIEAVYGVFALNHTTTVTVEQGQEWTLPISGSMLTNRSVVRFQRSADHCGEPMVAASTNISNESNILPDIPIQNDFTGFDFFGEHDESSEWEGGTSVIVSGHYVVLSQSLIRALEAPASYVLCLQPQRSLPWRAASSITLHVLEHVRRPTHYHYFPADGSEDVAALTALAPTKVALEWNTGEENMVNIIGAAGQQVSLALWCLPTPNASSSSSSASSSTSAIGIEEELVPCGDHRRVMFVKPLDNDDDPCFVDAEAVSDAILRGPYVLDFGVLTLPHSLSVVDGSTNGDSNISVPRIVPNMTQPWIMCLETGPERWREPTYPMLQLQYTRAIPTGFRLRADDASNTTAPFPAHKSNVEAMTTAEVDNVTGMPIGGNTTLFLYAQDSSQVVYLNGYGIQRGHRVRFGSYCEEEMAPPNINGSSSSDSNNDTAASQMNDYFERVAKRQALANPRLYAEPLTIEDDNGVFLIPSTHILEPEVRHGGGASDIPMCLSSKDGHTYKRTSLALRVLPSRLHSDTETKYRNLLEQILANTLLVPQHSRGSVDLSDLVKAAKGMDDVSGSSSDVSITTATTTAAALTDNTTPGRNDKNHRNDTNSSRSSDVITPPVYVTVGTQVLLSASCSVNTHGLPLLTMNVPNIITLTKQHTAAVTSERLFMCFRDADAAASAAAAQPPDDNTTENDMGAVTLAFLWYGLYYRVMGIQVDQVSLHAWTPTAAMKSDNINHVVLRRGSKEDLLLPVKMDASSPTASTTSSEVSPEDELLQRMQRNPLVMSQLSLTRLYVGRPCFRFASASNPVMAISPYVASYAGVQLNFSADAVTVSPLVADQHAFLNAGASLDKTMVAALPSGGEDGSVQVPQYPLEARGSVCFSVDGGLQYLAVGIAQYTEDWAPTLRVTIDAEGNANSEDVAEVDDDEEEAVVNGTVTHGRGSTTRMRVYAQSSTTRRLIDTRFVDPQLLTNEKGSILQVSADLGQLTTRMLWSGFIGENGFAADGILYLPAASKLTQAEAKGGAAQPPLPLRFSLDNRLQNVSTNLSVTVVPWSLTCYGASSQQEVFVRQHDVGLQVDTVPGVCSAGVRDGARVRVVPLSAAACDDPAVVDATYVMDLLTVQPGSWGVVTTPSRSNSLSSLSSFRAMQLPMSLHYVPAGTYALCLRQDLPFVSTLYPTDENANGVPSSVLLRKTLYSAVYAPTPLRLHVSDRWTILSISGATINGNTDTTAAATASSVVALAQGSNAELAVAGTAVGVRGVPLLLALAPSRTQEVTRRRSFSNHRESINSTITEAWTWSKGCMEVPELWDPATGASLLVYNATTKTGKLLTMPWFNVQGGVWKVDAAYSQEVEWRKQASSSSRSSDGYALASYTVCYSVDGGLTFHPAGVDLESTATTTTASNNIENYYANTRTTSAPFSVVVVPPAITSLSASRDTRPGREATVEQLNWTATTATATLVRVQQLFTSAAADAALPAVLPQVTSFSRVDGTNVSAAYATRPHRYGYAWTGAFVGNGVGEASGRSLSEPSSPSASRIPTVAAAVALVRTSLHGASCNGMNAVPESFTFFNTSNKRDGSSTDNWGDVTRASPLATPIFLINLQHGGVWSSADTTTVEVWRRAQTNNERVAAFDDMNIVLGRAEWVKNTVEMWALSGAPLNGPLLMGRATTEAVAAARSHGESILVCLSTDGAHFYSADVAHSAFAGASEEESQQSETVSAATASSTAAIRLSPWPLYLRACPPPSSSNTTAPLWMRETAMVMELLARPANFSFSSSSASPLLTIKAASLTRFQAAVAAQLGVATSVVVVQLAPSGTVTLPQTDTPPTTTTTRSAPVQLSTLRKTPSSVGSLSTLSAMDDEILLFATQAVQARHEARVYAIAEEETETAAETGTAQNAQQLPTYALVVSIIADAVAYNATANTSTLTASPDLLYRIVMALRHNVSGPALLTALVPQEEQSAVSLYPLTVNFTMSNGVDLHSAVSAATLPTSPAQEVAWRTLFLSIPYATISPETVPDAEDNDTTSKVSWWVIPILLILPVGMIYGTYVVYKKYLRKSPPAAAQVTVETIS